MIYKIKKRADAMSKSLRLGFTFEVNPEGWDDASADTEYVLVANEGAAMAWMDTGGSKAYVGRCVDTSDPAVGIFGAYEPAAWQSGDRHEKALAFACVDDAAKHLVMLAFERRLDEVAMASSETL